MLHVRERGELPAVAPAGEGDVFSPSTGKRYDIKRFYLFWPPGAGHAPGIPYTPDRGAFTPDGFERNLAPRLREGHRRDRRHPAEGPGRHDARRDARGDPAARAGRIA